MSQKPSTSISTSSNNDDEIQKHLLLNKQSLLHQELKNEPTDEGNNSEEKDSLLKASPLLEKNELENDQGNNSEAKDSLPNEPNDTCAYWYLLPFFYLFWYFVVGVAFYMIGRDLKNTTSTTVTFVDALYFSAVTLSTVGYGDIFPNTTVAKIFTCVFIMVGFVLGFKLNNVFGHICGAIEAGLVRMRDEGKYNAFLRAWMFDDKNIEMSKRAKVCISVVAIVLLIALGTIIAHGTEKLNWIDSFYVSITSVTTVGYGDFSFKTTAGKWCASIWILISTIVVASSFTYLSEYDLQRRSGDMTQWILKKKITASDRLDKDGLIRGYDFAIHMLRQMGKLSDREIQAIDTQFNSMPKDANGNIILINNFVENA